MTFKIDYHEVEIPELDSFLKEYDALCKKHGMRLAAEEYGSGGCYTTIEPYGGDLYLNLDYADEKVPCIAEARNRVRKIREEEKRTQHQKQKSIENKAPADPVVALEGLLKHMPTGYWSDDLHAAKASAVKALKKLRSDT